jgi:SAM-dependent methyltransferase
MYNTFSGDYDRFVNWADRLTYEIPFIEQQINRLQKTTGQPLDILDTACGTGMHAIALAKLGHRVSAADLYPQMIEKSLQNSQNAGVSVHFETAGLGDMARTFAPEHFDLVLCLGNSLPHLLSEKELMDVLTDFADCLRPGGLLLIQNRNFDAVMLLQERWMEPQTHFTKDVEWVFQRFYDFLPGRLIRFNIVTLKREGDSGWNASVASTILRPQLQAEIMRALTQTGFEKIREFGSMTGDDFSPDSSSDLILTAVRK